MYSKAGKILTIEGEITNFIPGKNYELHSIADEKLRLSLISGRSSPTGVVKWSWWSLWKIRLMMDFFDHSTIVLLHSTNEYLSI